LVDVQTARQTERSRCRILFQSAGSCIDLFRQAIASGQLHVALWFLLLVQDEALARLEGDGDESTDRCSDGESNAVLKAFEEARECAEDLLEAAGVVDSDDLAAQVSGFIHRLDAAFVEARAMVDRRRQLAAEGAKNSRGDGAVSAAAVPPPPPPARRRSSIEASTSPVPEVMTVEEFLQRSPPQAPRTTLQAASPVMARSRSPSTPPSHPSGRPDSVDTAVGTQTLSPQSTRSRQSDGSMLSPTSAAMTHHVSMKKFPGGIRLVAKQSP
jgi:hypothetical protein